MSRSPHLFCVYYNGIWTWHVRRIQQNHQKSCRWLFWGGTEKTRGELRLQQLLSDSGWLSIHQLISYTTILTIYKIVKTGEPIGLANRLRREGEQVGGGRGRHELDIRVQGRLNVTREGLVYRGGVMWNSLPVEIRQEHSLHRFKKRVKIWIKENVSQSI